MVLVLSPPSYAPRVNLRVFAPQFLICKVGAIPTLPSLESILGNRGFPVLTFFALSPKQLKREEQMVGGGDSQNSLKLGLICYLQISLLSNRLCIASGCTLVMPGQLGYLSAIVCRASILILSSCIVLPLRPLNFSPQKRMAG